MRFLARIGLGGCLADDMGLGKTATALAHLLDRPGPHLVVCPLSVVHNWQSEATRFAPSLAVTIHHGAQRAGRTDAPEVAPEFASDELVITTYGLATRDIDQLALVDWGTVIADEAQFVKNPATKAARAIRRLRAAQRLALTGTPVENRLSELWSILDWTNPGMLGSRERFRHRYSKPIERADDSELAAEAAASLRALTQPFVLRRTKADRALVPDLPDKIEQVAWAGLTREQAVLYQQVVDQLLADAADTTGMKRRSLVLASITKLKQICNHPLNATGEDGRIAGRSGKLARFDELVDELLDVDERALVFTQYVTMGNLLVRHLAARFGWTVPFLSGSVARTRRDALVAAFQAGQGPPLLLVSLKAGGTGLNLTAASQVIHYDRWWNPAVENQASDRAWRIGQRQVVTVHKMVCEGTVEERIAQLIDDKQALADVVVGQGEAWLTELTTAQLQDLVRLDAVAALGAGTEERRGRGRRGELVSRPRHAFGAQPGRLPATLLRALCAELSDPARYRRAKDYARDGAVIDLDVRPGAVVGEVLGSRRSPYRVTIVADPVDDAATATSPVMLIPERTELAVACTCPDADSGAMCKHALALLLVFADEVSIEPELLARWRARGDSAPTGVVRLRGRAAIAPRTRPDPGWDRGGERVPRAGAGRRARIAARLADADRRAGTDGSVGAGGARDPGGARRRDVGRARPRPRRRRRHDPPRALSGRRRGQSPFNSERRWRGPTPATDENGGSGRSTRHGDAGARWILAARRHDRPGRPAPVRRRGLARRARGDRPRRRRSRVHTRWPPAVRSRHDDVARRAWDWSRCSTLVRATW